MQAATVVVTGITGTIGRFLAAELTADGHHVIGMMRNAAARGAELASWIDARGGRAASLELVDSDLARADLGLCAADRRRLEPAELVVHLGAAVTWGLRAGDAREVNVRGTERMLELATELPALRRFVLVSGYGVGLAPATGPIPGGHYEVTKVEADRRARAFATRRGLALTRVHPAAVIGHSQSGELLSMFGFGDVVEGIVRGKMPAIPGCARHVMPLVTVDYLARFLARVALADTEPQSEYYLLDQATPAFPALVRSIASHAGVRAPRLSVSMGVARLVARATRDAAMIEGLHFLTDRRLDTSSADRAAAAAGLAMPDVESAIERSVAWLLRHQLRRAS